MAQTSSAVHGSSYYLLSTIYGIVKLERVQIDLTQLSKHVRPHLTTADEAVVVGPCAEKKPRHGKAEVFARSREIISGTASCWRCTTDNTLYRMRAEVACHSACGVRCAV